MPDTGYVYLDGEPLTSHIILEILVIYQKKEVYTKP